MLKDVGGKGIKCKIEITFMLKNIGSFIFKTMSMTKGQQGNSWHGRGGGWEREYI